MIKHSANASANIPLFGNMEESEVTDSSVLPAILAAMFLLIIIGIVIWFIMTRTLVGPGVTVVPVSNLTPSTSNNTSSTTQANPPTGIPIIESRGRSCCPDDTREHDTRHGSGHNTREDSTEDGHESNRSSRSHSRASTRDNTEDSTRDSGSSSGSGSILLYNRSLQKRSRLALPCDRISVVAWCSGELYCSTSSSIYVQSGDNWDLVGSLEEESITEMFEDRNKLRVRTESGDYILDHSRDRTKMSQCRRKERLCDDKELELDRSRTLLHGGDTVAENVDCFCTDGSSIAYISSSKLYLRESDTESDTEYSSSREEEREGKCKRLEHSVEAICMNDTNIYLLVNNY